MKRTILQTAMLSALAASLVCAQTTTTPTPPTPAQIAANIVARLTTLLDLTSSQQTSATAIFITDATTDQSLQTQMQAAQTALQTAITSDSTTGIAAAHVAAVLITAVEIRVVAAVVLIGPVIAAGLIHLRAGATPWVGAAGRGGVARIVAIVIVNHGLARHEAAAEPAAKSTAAKTLPAAE